MELGLDLKLLFVGTTTIIKVAHGYSATVVAHCFYVFPFGTYFKGL